MASSDPAEQATEQAWAKVNLFLHVTGKRPDGYHLLDSLVVFAAVGDRLAVSGHGMLSLTVTGAFATGLAAEPDNLVLRAARGLADLACVPARGALVLEKNLPVSSGIGGGSADAAAALRLLGRHWGLVPAPAGLLSLATELGADVPVCLASVPTRMSGIGEVLSPAPALADCGLVLINPGVPVATASVFRSREPGFSPVAALPHRWGTAVDMADCLQRCRNDLEESAIRLAPVIGEVLRTLRRYPDCLLARMSGSGATCFGLFPDAALARRAAMALARPGWWSWGGALHQP